MSDSKPQVCGRCGREDCVTVGKYSTDTEHLLADLCCSVRIVAEQAKVMTLPCWCHEWPPRPGTCPRHA
jgi:hypothetical protein